MSQPLIRLENLSKYYTSAQNVVVAAESFGLGSCYIGDFLENYEVQKEILNLPKYVVPAVVVVFGYPTKQQIDRVKPPRFTAVLFI